MAPKATLCEGPALQFLSVSVYSETSVGLLSSLQAPFLTILQGRPSLLGYRSTYQHDYYM